MWKLVLLLAGHTAAELIEKLSQEEFEWIEILGGGGWVPPEIEGFMTEKQYLSSLHYQEPPVPIVMRCDSDNAALEAAGKEIRLQYGGYDLGKLVNAESYLERQEERIARTYGSSHPEHPYVERWILHGMQKKYLCGGKLELVKGLLKQEPYLRHDGLDEYRLTVPELKAKFANHDAVFVFQLRNPIHNGHALLMQDTYQQLLKKGYKKPVLWINPVGGWVKDDDVPLYTRMRQHEALIRNKVFGDCPVILSIFPSPMVYGGPREVQWHAISRLNAGSTHYIVGRDPAGVKHPDGNGGDLYEVWDGQKMLGMNKHLQGKIEFVPFQVAAYNVKEGKMTFIDPSLPKDTYKSISGTKMRKMAAEGEDPPKGFMDPEGWSILKKYYQDKRDEL